MSSVKVATIGCGRRASAHLEPWKQIPGASLVACCAPSGQRRDPLAARYGITAYDNPEKMIREVRPDVVHIITNPDSRVQLMTLVSDLGVPVCTVEKPIASGVADWQALSRLSQVTSTRFAICHQFRWHANLVRCQQALTSGELGPLRFIEMSAGMNIAGQGTHTLDYGMSLNGDSAVVRVFGNCSAFTGTDKAHPGPDNTVAQLEFANGVRGLWTSGITAFRSGDPATTYQHVRVAGWAEQGRVVWEEFGRTEIVSHARNISEPFSGRDDWTQGNLAAQGAFYRALLEWRDGGKEPGTSLAHALHQWKVVLALYHSTVKRVPVVLEEFTPEEG